ncbi:MAG: FAD-binding oxidoreductase [Vicinamibacterales bacterium]
MIQPGNPNEVAAALRRASESGQTIVIRGAGTKSAWGRPPSRVDTILDMRRLNRILAHEHGDMTATIEAGTSLHAVNEALAIHGQTLPLDPPFADRATIGGLLATNDSGPLRHRYGTPRDLVIGIELATTDGTLSKAGGRVVKNVAGYDLSKLVTGSFGSLAAIVSATFKLAPLPAGSKTMRIGLRDARALGQVVHIMMASQLEPVAFEVGTAGTLHLLLRFASLPAVVDAQIAQATSSLSAWAASIDVLDGRAELAIWTAHAAELWHSPGAILRASWLPASMTAVLDELERAASDLGGATMVTGRAAVGAGHVAVTGDASAQAAFVERLRASSTFGNVVVVRGSAELKALVDVWGSSGDRQPLFDSLKRAFDPNGVLNAGRGPL